MPPSVGPGRRVWSLLPTVSHGFNTIGFKPEGSVYYQYGVSSDGDSAYTVEARSDIDGDGSFNTWGYVKPSAGTGTGIAGPFAVCAPSGTYDDASGLKNQLNQVGPCDQRSGKDVF